MSDWTAHSVFRSLLLFFLIANGLSGCALIKLSQEVDASQQSTIIVGRVYGDLSGAGQLIVAASPVEDKNKITDYAILHHAGEYELIVTHGSYTVFAFWDSNNNLAYDANEPYGLYQDGNAVSAPAVGVVSDIDFAVGSAPTTTAVAATFAFNLTGHPAVDSHQAGDIVTLDDARFARENGVKGFWEPLTFYREQGGNIYFLEPYDPDKIPVLFIHGATGTPHEWTYFVEHMDHTRFQPWFFYYPSGVRIDSMAHLLFWKLINLQTRYQFKTLFVTAHSMGGLVSRQFLLTYGSQFPYIKLLVTLATPWGGDSMAEFGVQQAPAVIPSWIDMQPEGDFIQSLYRERIPHSVDFYMFSGYRGNNNPFGSNNDGTISLSSIMDQRAQAEAKMNYLFNEDHASILTSAEVLMQYNAILAQKDESQASVRRQAGGYLDIHFAYAYPSGGVRPQPIFVLRSVGKKEAVSVSYLDSQDSRKRYGPYPPGQYSASLLTAGGHTTSPALAVTVESNSRQDLDFMFEPDGQINGYVTAPLAPRDKSPGRPNVSYRASDENIRIQSIELTGNAIHRVIRPLDVDEIDPWSLLIARTDFCYQRYFGFFDLPSGDYSVVVKVEGYPPIEQHFSVVPGIPNNVRAIELGADLNATP